MSSQTAQKTRTNVSINEAVLREARALKLNVSAISEAALEQAVSAARAEHWASENAEALKDREAWLDATGMPLAEFQVLRTG